jgi:hypothetical protein
VIRLPLVPGAPRPSAHLSTPFAPIVPALFLPTFKGAAYLYLFMILPRPRPSLVSTKLPVAVEGQYSHVIISPWHRPSLRLLSIVMELQVMKVRPIASSIPPSRILLLLPSSKLWRPLPARGRTQGAPPNRLPLRISQFPRQISFAS